MQNLFRLNILAGMIVLIASVPLSAQTFDLFQTDSSQSPSVNLSAIPGLSPSTVSFQGVPLQPQSCLGNTDTIIQRSDASGNLHPTVFGLMMKSTNDATNPVQYNGANVDVYVTINNSGNTIDQATIPTPDNPPQTPGTMAIGSDGTFNSTLNVNPDIILVPAGTSRDALNSNIIASFTNDSFKTALTATGRTGPTSSSYPNCAAYPTGGVQVTQLTHTAPSHVHQVVPACVSSSTGAASVGSREFVECAVLASPTLTTTSKTAPKPAAK